ncbi:50S ribosomal protein L19, partial [Striga asiatica]
SHSGLKIEINRQSHKIEDKGTRLLCYLLSVRPKTPAMASTFLHQALFMLPKIAAQSQPTNLAFSAAVPRTMPYSGALVSRVPATSYGFGLCQRGEKCSFIVRAEAADADVEESEANAESVGEDEEEADVLSPRKPRIKLGEIMGILNKRAIEASDKERPTPDLRSGDILEIKLEVPGNKRRLAVYKGIVISKQNAGIHTTIRIRRIIAGVGVEIVFPVEPYESGMLEIMEIGSDYDISNGTKQLSYHGSSHPVFEFLDGMEMLHRVHLHFEMLSFIIFLLVPIKGNHNQYSPLIKEIKVVSHRKVRRARLYYLRDKLPRFSFFK